MAAFIYPRINFARDSLVGMALGSICSPRPADNLGLMAELPRSCMLKEKMGCRSDRIRAFCN